MENWDLTEKGKKDLEQKYKILKDYFKNSKIILRYAGISKNRNIVFRIAKTAEILYKNLWKNIVWIVQEDGLDTREKVEFKGKDSVLDKGNALKKQEQETLEFYKELLEKFKNNNLENSEIDSEVHIIHSTNMDVIYRIINGEYHPKETWYHKLQMWEGFEIEISSSWEILKEKNEFIHLNSENYLGIIEELKNIKNEKILKAIKYFESWKIKIIDLQNVINKQILENDEFIKKFKNSNNLDLRKLAFINILKWKDFFDRKIEGLILQEKFWEKADEIIDNFYEIVTQNLDLKFIKGVVFDYENKKQFLEKFLKTIWKINSKKLLSLEQLDKIFEIYNYFKNAEEIDFWEYEEIIKNSVVWKGYSEIFWDDFDILKKELWVDEELEEQDFIFRVYLWDNKLDFYLYYKENWKEKRHKINLNEKEFYERQINSWELDINQEFVRFFWALFTKKFSWNGNDKKTLILNYNRKINAFLSREFWLKITQYIKSKYNYKANEGRDFWKNLLFNFTFKKWRLFQERENIIWVFSWKLNHKNLSFLLELENFFQESLISWEISEKFNLFISQNKELVLFYLEDKIFEIIEKYKLKIFSIIVNDSEKEDILRNYPFYSVLNYSKNISSLNEKELEKIQDLKQEFLKQFQVISKLFSRTYLSENEYFDGYRKEQYLEEFKELNELFEQI